MNIYWNNIYCTTSILLVIIVDHNLWNIDRLHKLLGNYVTNTPYYMGHIKWIKSMLHKNGHVVSLFSMQTISFQLFNDLNPKNFLDWDILSIG